MQFAYEKINLCQIIYTLNVRQEFASASMILFLRSTHTFLYDVETMIEEEHQR